MTAMTTPLGDRFSAMLDQCARERRLAFLLHLTLGDPSPEASLPLLETLAEAGADAFELAIPFSDPTADGPVLEESAHRALDAGTTVEKCFSLVRTFREKHPNVPLSLATYVNIAVAPGLERFFQSAAAAGFDAAALRDLPLAMREAEPEWDDAARTAGIGLAASVSGASCQRSLSGIAKQRGTLPFVILPERACGASATDAPPPVLLELEEGNLADIDKARAAGAAGIIAGTALGRIIEANLGNPQAMESAASDYVRAMKAACRPMTAR